MSAQTAYEILKALSLFKDLPDSVIEKAILHSRVELFEPNSSVLSEWDDSNHCAYVIMQWTASVLRSGLEVARLSRGDIFGEYALICDEKRSATIVSVDTLACLVITADTLWELATNDTKLNDILCKRIEANAKGTDEDSEEQFIESASRVLS